jgi:hypothetical protein
MWKPNTETDNAAMQSNFQRQREHKNPMRRTVEETSSPMKIVIGYYKSSLVSFKPLPLKYGDTRQSRELSVEANSTWTEKKKGKTVCETPLKNCCCYGCLRGIQLVTRECVSYLIEWCFIHYKTLYQVGVRGPLFIIWNVEVRLLTHIIFGGPRV